MLLNLVIHEHYLQRKGKTCKFHFDEEARMVQYKLAIFKGECAIVVDMVDATFNNIWTDIKMQPIVTISKKFNETLCCWEVVSDDKHWWW